MNESASERERVRQALPHGVMKESAEESRRKIHTWLIVTLVLVTLRLLFTLKIFLHPLTVVDLVELGFCV